MTAQFSPAAWMGQLPAETPLTGLLIPGTHDTMTASCPQRYYQTQTLSLAEQLQAGVRFFDLRIRANLVAAHREWISQITAEEIWDTLIEFLAAHPQEVVLIRVQNANEHKDDFPAYAQVIRGLAEKYAEWFYRDHLAETPLVWPTLGQAAGKIVALECAPPQFEAVYFPASAPTQGAENTADGQAQIRWAADWHENPQVLIQDLWDGPEIAQKKQAIYQSLTGNSSGAEGLTGSDEGAGFSQARPRPLKLNHISATNGELGYPDAYAQILNPYLAQLLDTPRTEHDRSRTRLTGQGEDEGSAWTGVQILDFVTEELASQIIAHNFKAER